MSTTTTTTISTTQSNIKLKYNIEDIVVDLPSFSKKFECNVCFNYILDTKKKEARQCIEGHIVCLPCWQQSLRGRKECTQCRSPVESVSKLSRNRFMEKEFEETLVKCPYSNQKIIKEAIGTQSINNINPNLIKLDILCDSVVKFKDLDNHLGNECHHRVFKCSCNLYYRIYSSEDHNKQCLLSNVKCEHCSKQIQRRLLQDHYKNDCATHLSKNLSKLSVKCDYQGCETELPIHKISDHITSHMNHLHSTIKQLENKNKEIMEKLEDVKSACNRSILEIVFLKGSLNNVRLGYANSLSSFWAISDYKSKLREYPHRKFLDSNAFNVGPFRFNWRIYPYGCPGNPGQTSLHLTSVELQGLDVTVWFNVRIENDNYLVERCKTFCFNEVHRTENGFPRLITSKELVFECIDKDGDLQIFFDIKIEKVESNEQDPLFS
ncbi:hypothetical protein DICPUDRAFT_76912 [Dictyostelium purpureum]|uniref:TRAF-type domain-containing protein n=1 Tax=Dictyostelium purpureum TaxID=5786 RepID=F0ZF13_DICPU|nr:uncharacterized protein DICPUDRAFT_76912 [Dictyostelium purpureum]EGC37440.1 hypothetical protein DICPUDRAFT_76912 [Dictyostelium purpureum]|eukprot:XP_003286004.1 hypothetical protein DICPUDRAFT_76912 [Dictyostelium purpureum]